MSLRRPWPALLALLGACGASSEPYTACRVSGSCGDEAPLCIDFRAAGTTHHASLCTRGCAVNADCPGGGVCVPTPGAANGFTALCLKRCALARECPIPHSLCGIIRAGDTACVPGG